MSEQAVPAVRHDLARRARDAVIPMAGKAMGLEEDDGLGPGIKDPALMQRNEGVFLERDDLVRMPARKCAAVENGHLRGTVHVVTEMAEKLVPELSPVGADLAQVVQPVAGIKDPSADMGAKMVRSGGEGVRARRNGERQGEEDRGGREGLDG